MRQQKKFGGKLAIPLPAFYLSFEQGHNFSALSRFPSNDELQPAEYERVTTLRAQLLDSTDQIVRIFKSQKMDFLKASFYFQESKDGSLVLLYADNLDLKERVRMPPNVVLNAGYNEAMSELRKTFEQHYNDRQRGTG